MSDEVKVLHRWPDVHSGDRLFRVGSEFGDIEVSPDGGKHWIEHSTAYSETAVELARLAALCQQQAERLEGLEGENAMLRETRQVCRDERTSLSTQLLGAAAERDRMAAEVERLRGGPPGPWPDCTDCGRAMVWSNPDQKCPTWMCPRCCHRRMRRSERSQELLTKEEEEAVEEFAALAGEEE